MDDIDIIYNEYRRSMLAEQMQFPPDKDVVKAPKPIMTPIELDERIEELTKAEKLALLKLSHTIKPVLRCDFYQEFVRDDGVFYNDDGSATIDLYTDAYYSEKPVRMPEKYLNNRRNEVYKEGFYGFVKAGKKIFKHSFLSKPKFLDRARNLQYITTISTYHYIQRQFLPTEAEVLLQLPEEFLKEVDAYEVFPKLLPYSRSLTPD